MKKIKSLASGLFLSLILTSVSAHAENISGLGYGIAPDTTGNLDFDRQTVLVIPSSAQNGPTRITYLYPALEIACHSDLVFDDVRSNGTFPNLQRVWTFDDQPQVAPCELGTVRITAGLQIYGQVNSVYFEWIDQGGNVDNAGTRES
jgi:hypothetical protein